MKFEKDYLVSDGKKKPYDDEDEDEDDNEDEDDDEDWE